MLSGKKILLSIVFMVIMAVGYMYWRKYRQSQKLTIGIDSMKPNFKNIGALTTAMLTSAKIPVLLKPFINNFSPSTFKIQQLQIAVYSSDGQTLISSQNLPLSEKAIIAPNSKTVLTLDFSFAPLAFFNSAGRKLGVSDIVNWYQGKQMGVNLLLKGFFVAEGIKIPLNTTITI